MPRMAKQAARTGSRASALYANPPPLSGAQVLKHSSAGSGGKGVERKLSGAEGSQKNLKRHGYTHDAEKFMENVFVRERRKKLASPTPPCCAATGVLPPNKI